MDRLVALAAVGLLAVPAPAADPWPDPLKGPDGTAVTDRAAWESKRKPQLKAEFEREMYGRRPAVTGPVTGVVLHEDKQALGGKATLREVAVTVAAGAPAIHWLIVVPNNSPGPVPAFVGLNFSGNHSVTSDPKVRVPQAWMYANRPGAKNNRATDAGRNTAAATWPLEAIIGKGFAVATCYSGEIIPDDPKERGGLSDLLRPVPAPADGTGTGVVMAWAWGLGRGVDYVATVPGVDPKRLIAVGHSRLGKAAIVAAAFEDRITAVVANQAGCGGTAPSRRTNLQGEPVERINKAFPHWFADNFKKYGDDPSKLPFDQHALVALCAPKPVLFTCATADQWADPPGEFEVLKGAAPVYALYGHKGAAAETYPAENTRVGGKLAFWVRPGKHEMGTADWASYLDWAAVEVK